MQVQVQVVITVVQVKYDNWKQYMSLTHTVEEIMIIITVLYEIIVYEIELSVCSYWSINWIVLG